jgi:hypothetical protein
VDLTVLSAVELADATGNRRALGTLWSERPVILVFLRHFG